MINFLFTFIPSHENTFILTGVELPSPSADRDERQKQLKLLAESVILKLDPELAIHKINYVRVVKAPKPSILEVECATAERYPLSKLLICLKYC